jgi:hypothetical protein
MLERALCIHRPILHGSLWMVIGRLESGTPFLLHYHGYGVTSWDCAERLSVGLRRKILALFAETCRTVAVRPPWVVFEDLCELDRADDRAARERAGELFLTFHREVWRGEYLNDWDEDYVVLKVPFAEKDQAKAAGARWEPAQKVWRVKRQADLSAFARWI